METFDIELGRAFVVAHWKQIAAFSWDWNGGHQDAGIVCLSWSDVLLWRDGGLFLRDGEILESNADTAVFHMRMDQQIETVVRRLLDVSPDDTVYRANEAVLVGFWPTGTISTTPLRAAAGPPMGLLVIAGEPLPPECSAFMKGRKP